MENNQRKRFKISKFKFLLRILKNPFPSDDMQQYYDSSFYHWIDRIHKGQKEEQERISKIVDGLDDEIAEIYAEDYFKAAEVSGLMFAALTVAMWSNIEIFMGRLIRICEEAGKDPFKGDHHKINDVNPYFYEKLNISLKKLRCSDIANALRVMSNSFKHNNGRYHADKFPIDGSIKRKYSIEENRPIEYEKLPFEDLIKGCYEFCNDLETQVRTSIDN